MWGRATRLIVVAFLVLSVAVGCGSADDLDGDGLKNSEEKELGTNPENDDTDGDGVIDPVEVREGTNPLDPNDPEPQASGDSATASDTVEPSEEPQETDEPDVSSPGIEITKTETCHNFATAGGFSDGRFYGHVVGHAGGTVRLVVTVKNAAPGRPEVREASASFGESGQFVAVFALFQPGEVLVIRTAFVDGSEVTGVHGRLEVAPLEGTPDCEPL